MHREKYCKEIKRSNRALRETAHMPTLTLSVSNCTSDSWIRFCRLYRVISWDRFKPECLQLMVTDVKCNSQLSASGAKKDIWSNFSDSRGPVWLKRNLKLPVLVSIKTIELVWLWPWKRSTAARSGGGRQKLDHHVSVTVTHHAIKVKLSLWVRHVSSRHVCSVICDTMTLTNFSRLSH